MKNILITGGAGFIGSNLALKLLERGHVVTVLDNLSIQIHGEAPELNSPLYLSIKDKVKFIKGSVTNKGDWMQALQDQHIIVHLAAETGTGQSMYEIEKYNNVNIGGTAIMLDLLTNTKHQVEKIVIASSRAIYGEGKYKVPATGAVVYPVARKNEDMLAGKFEVTVDGVEGPLELLPTTEDSKIQPTSVYGITKQVQEQLIMTVAPSIGIAPVALRYQNVFGAGQSLKNPYTGILSIFSNLIRSNKEINIFEDGLESRDFIYVDDIVNATILSIENDAANGEVFNVGTGVATDVMTIARLLIKLYNRPEIPIRVSGNFRVGDIRHNYADISKIQHKLGFAPAWSLEEGLKKLTDWVKSSSPVENKYEESISEMKKKGLLK